MYERKTDTFVANEASSGHLALAIMGAVTASATKRRKL